MPKLIDGNGHRLEVRDVSEPLYTLKCPFNGPVPVYEMKIVSDDEARELIRSLKVRGLEGTNHAGVSQVRRSS